jgi:hypothetical protein
MGCPQIICPPLWLSIAEFIQTVIMPGQNQLVSSGEIVYSKLHFYTM